MPPRKQQDLLVALQLERQLELRTGRRRLWKVGKVCHAFVPMVRSATSAATVRSHSGAALGRYRLATEARALQRRTRLGAHPREQPVRHGTSVWMSAPVALRRLPPGRRSRFGLARLVELLAVDSLRVDVDRYRVAVLEQRDGPALESLRRDVSDHKADRATGKAAIRHQPDRDALLTAERRDFRRRIEHFGHSRRATRPFVPD